MSITDKRDILLHFDEDREEIIYFTVDSKSIESVRNREFDGAKSDIKWFQDKDPDEAEKALGSMVFSLIDAFSMKKIAIRDYQSLNEASHQEYLSELEAQSNSNNPEAMYSLFIEYHSRALKEKSLAHLGESERLLNSAANLGHHEAKDHLEKNWELLKQVALKRVQSG